jgi:hypothetical protein
MLIASLQPFTFREPVQTLFSETEVAGTEVGVVVFAPIAGTGCLRQAAGAATGVALGVDVAVALEVALELGDAVALGLGVEVAVGLGEAVTEPGPKLKNDS